MKKLGLILMLFVCQSAFADTVEPGQKTLPSVDSVCAWVSRSANQIIKSCASGPKTICTGVVFCNKDGSYYHMGHKQVSAGPHVVACGTSDSSCSNVTITACMADEQIKRSDEIIPMTTGSNSIAAPPAK